MINSRSHSELVIRCSLGYEVELANGFRLPTMGPGQGAQGESKETQAGGSPLSGTIVKAE